MLDAKYRSSRFGVLDAMESAHLYHDCLRWNGYKADAVLLMIPQGGRVPILESPDFQASNGIGAVVMGGQEDATKFGEQLVALLFCDASAYRSGVG
ncbi:hypothetical protein D3C85_1676260 [compost metagenome]